MRNALELITGTAFILALFILPAVLL